MSKKRLCARGTAFPGEPPHAIPKPRPKGFHGRMLKKLLLMKFMMLLLTAAFMQVYASSKAQSITLSGKDLPLKKVFAAMEAQAGVVFFYNIELLKDTRPVSVAVKNMPLNQFLALVMKDQPVDYEISDVAVVIKAKKNRTAPQQPVILPPLKGRVTDASGSPLPGASISVKGTSRSAITDENGRFSIDASPDDILVITFMGFLSREIAVKDAGAAMEIKLQEDSRLMGEVVVLGFGQTQKKIAQTGAISSISNKELMQSPVSNITNALAGRLPGLFTVQRSGEPGRDKSDLFIRGRATLNSTAPLVTIDGVQKDYSAITTLDPNEIENITILKDASATALYGVKGANGVVIVTTRRGKEGKPVMTFRTQSAMQVPTRMPRFLGSYDFARLYNEAYLNDNPGGTQMPYSEEALEAYRTGSDPLKYPDVDWIDEVVKNSLSSQTNLNLSGGGKMVRYFVNMGYMYQDGLYKTQKNDLYNPNFELKRYNFRSNVDIDFDKDFSVALNLYGSIEDRNYPNVSAGNMFGSLLSRIPPNAFPVRYPTGFWGIHATGYGNPLARINNSGFTQEFNSSLSGMASAIRKLDFITEGLSIKANFSFDGYFKNNFSRTMDVRKAVYNGTGDYNDPTNYTYRDQDLPLSAPNSTFNQNRDTWIDLSLNYQRSFGRHSFIGMLLANRQQQVRGGEIPYVSQGLVARVAYNYNNRYFAEFNAGYNGTDNFARSNRYGFFPAVSAGWVAVAGKPVIDLLKLRGSFGLTGNDQLTVSNRRWLFIEEYQTGTGYSFGEQLANIPGVKEGALANPLVTWETAQRSNAGIELKLFRNSLLGITADVFYEKRKDMLVLPQSIPYMSGIPSADLPPANFGTTENKGFEIEVTHRNRVRGISYFLTANTSFARNKILEMDEETQAYPNLFRTGRPIGQEFGLIAIGFFKDKEDVINSREQTFGKVIPGDLKYYDVNGDGIIDNNDQAPIGKSTIPELMYGFSGGLNFRNWDFSFLLQGGAGFSYVRELETAYEFYNGGKVMDIHLGRWTPATAATATYPVLHTGFNDNNHRKSTFFLRKADYLRLKNLELGYTFRQLKISKKTGFSSVRIYGSGLNLFTIDATEGDFDPEASGGRYWSYPQVKVFNLGVSANF